MCDCYFNNPPTFYDSATVKGRKDHKCAECLRVIPKGELHEYAKGLWDGRFDDFRTCETCQELIRECGITCYCHELLMDELDERDYPDSQLVRAFFDRRRANYRRLEEAR